MMFLKQLAWCVACSRHTINRHVVTPLLVAGMQPKETEWGAELSRCSSFWFPSHFLTLWCLRQFYPLCRTAHLSSFHETPWNKDPRASSLYASEGVERWDKKANKERWLSQLPLWVTGTWAPETTIWKQCKHASEISHSRHGGSRVFIHQLLLVPNWKPLLEGDNTLALPVAQVSNMAFAGRESPQQRNRSIGSWKSAATHWRCGVRAYGWDANSVC